MKQNKNAKLDYLSLLLSSVGFGGLLYGFSSASSDGWTNKVVLTALIIGAIALIAFIIRQLKWMSRYWIYVFTSTQCLHLRL